MEHCLASSMKCCKRDLDQQTGAAKNFVTKEVGSSTDKNQG